MTTLADFLLARIAEEQREAEECSSSPWVIGHDFEKVENRDGWVADGWASDVRLFVRWQPSRVLAECAAHKAIVEECDGFDEQGQRVLRALASVYADHPEYQQEWGP